MKNVEWIKIKTDMFNDEKILLIEALPEGDTLLVIWLKLLCQAGNSNAGGQLLIADYLPINDEMAATLFRRPLNTIRMALQVFERMGMIEFITEETKDRTIVVSNWGKHQNADALENIRESARLRKQRERERKTALVSSDREINKPKLMNCSGLSRDSHIKVTTGLCDMSQQNHTTVTGPVPGPSQENREREKREKEKDFKERESNGKIFDSPETAAEKTRQVSLSPLATLWNSVCTNLPQVTALSQKRTHNEKIRLREHNLDWWKIVFEHLSKSMFCSGENDRGWRADYDWIIESENNAIKVLEGKYDNPKDPVPSGSKSIDPYRRDLNIWNSLPYERKRTYLNQGGFGLNSDYPEPGWLRKVLEKIESKSSVNSGG